MLRVHHMTGGFSHGFDPVTVAYVALIFLVMFAPMLFRRRPRPSGPEEEGSGGGGGGSGGPPQQPVPPRGGVPLANAEQSPARRRDEHGPRSAPEPSRRRRVHRPAPSRRPHAPV